MKFLFIYSAGLLSSYLILLMTIIKKNLLESIILLLVLFPIIYQSRRAMYLIIGPFIIMPITILLLLLFYISNLNKAKINEKDLLLIFSLLILTFLTSLFTNNVEWAMRGFQMIILEPFLLYLIVVSAVVNSNQIYGHEYTLNVIGRGVYFSLIFVLLIIFVETLLSGGLSFSALLTRQANIGQGGFTGGYEEPAILAIYFCIFLPIALFFFPILKRNRTNILILLLSFMSLVLTFSRTALGILLVDFFFILVFSRIPFKKKALVFIFIVLFSFLFSIILEQRALASEKYSAYQSIELLGMTIEAKGGMLQRLASLKDVLNILNDFNILVFGKGALSEITFWNNLSDLTLSQLKPISSIGNGYLTFILYFGFVSTLLYLYFFLRRFKEIVQERRKNPRLLWLLLVPLNFLLYLLVAQGGLISYGYLSHFPGWNDLNFIYFSIFEGLRFLPTNMLIMVVFFGISLTHAIVVVYRNKDILDCKPEQQKLV